MDVEEIIEYIKTLKKGFDKELFQNKIDELGYIVDNGGLNHDDFLTLFKVWLNLTIPITKWVNLGACIVPQEKVSRSTIEYALRWILANYENQSAFTRIGFLLDWLTAAMDSDSVDMNALDMGFELFYSMLTFEALTVHAIKLVYTLTKPSDVTRRRVVELMDYAKKREAKKNMFRQIQVLLGLFKSYKPEYVPEDVPSISIHTAFKKINMALLTRFKHTQVHRNNMTKQTHRLLWVNPVNSEAGRNKKADPLIPNMEFTNIGSKQYNDSAQKNYLDFSDPVSLVQYSTQRALQRPARLRALLCNPAGLALLAAAAPHHAFLHHELHHLLASCFLETSPYTSFEKQDLLQRFAILQSTLMQGIPVVTRFLAQFLPFWNEKDFFSEILQLLEWVNVESPGHIVVILDTLAKIYHRAQPIEQCAILKTVTAMYTNLVYGSTRSRHHFLNMEPSENLYTEVMNMVSNKISDICNKSIQASPEDMRVVLGGAGASVRAARGCARAAPHVPAAPVAPAAPHVPVAAARVLAAALLAPSAAALELVAHLVMTYREILSAVKARSGSKDQTYVEQIQILQAFTADFVGCFREEAISGRKKGIVFSKLHPQLVSKLENLIPDVDSKLSIRNHLAFAPYTYVSLQGIDHTDADNKLLFDTVIEQEFLHLSTFLKRVMPELR